MSKSSEENQDEGSKRSLMWFMSTVRRDKGDAKAAWLWRRMGTLCTRTVMSIIPTLSREYDQHFKSFSNVPVDISKILSSAGYTASSAPNQATVPRGPTSGKSSSAHGINRGDRNSRTTSVKGNATESEDEEEEEDDGQILNNMDGKKADGAPVLPDGIAGGETPSIPPSNDDSEKFPKTRGSRCFEVLGFDIMLDSNYKPWLIEVNHLPSFGTDSPLDKDIKERLMEQVFSILPVMADDQQAYLAHHKAESEKRLVAQRTVLKTTESDRSKPAPPRKKESMLPPVRDQTMMEVDSTISLFAMPVAESLPQPPHETASEIKSIEETEEEDDIVDEECTPERLLEIKLVLLDVYKKFSAEKTSKIDRLLAKYLGHEEEFLRFVFGKYNVDMKVYKRTGQLVTVGELSDERADVSPVDVVVQSSEGPKERALSSNPKGRQPNINRILVRFHLPALKNALWHHGKVDPKKMLLTDPNEEWMQFELSKLSQFTRIFPPEHFGVGVGAKDKIGGVEDEVGRDDDGNGDEDNDEDDTNNIGTNGGLTSLE
eukprot:gene30346-37546_t